MQQRASQAAAQEAHRSSSPMHTAGTPAPQTGADMRSADLSAMPQQGSASPQHAQQQAQQAIAQMSAPLSLPPSMVRIAAALPPMQQQVMVCISACPCMGHLADPSASLATCFGMAWPFKLAQEWWCEAPCEAPWHCPAGRSAVAEQLPENIIVALQMQQMALVMQKQMHMQQQGLPGPPSESSGLPINLNLTQQQLQGQLVPFRKCTSKCSQPEGCLPCTLSPLLSVRASCDAVNAELLQLVQQRGRAWCISRTEARHV